jgi:uncharacterized protein YhbP (UPF0306 family)
MQGTPQVCAVWYVHNIQLDLYFLTSLTTLHGRTLERGGEIAFTINQDDQDWRLIRGLQGRGNVSMLENPKELQDYWELYCKKYPFVRDQFTDLVVALQKTKLWKISPTWLRLIDNSIEFGHKEEWSNVEENT